jgi:hypothetical protein
MEILRMEMVPESDYIDLLQKTFRSGTHSSEGNCGNKENRSYQEAEATPDQRISIFRGENAAGIT